MKESPSDHVKIVKRGPKGKQMNVVEQAPKKPWKSVINFEELGPLLPGVREVSGSKAKLCFNSFQTMDSILQAVFDKNHATFQTRSQVDRLAHYIGGGILEQVYLVLHGHSRSKLSLLEEKYEEVEERLDQMQRAKEKLQKKINLFTSGVISDDEVYAYWDELLECFNQEERIRLEAIFNDMFDRGEALKSKDRVRKQIERRGLRVVESEEGN